MRSLEKRRSQRHSQIFDTVEERDQFLRARFPTLVIHGRPGFFRTPEGLQVRVWYKRVVWQEPAVFAEGV